MQIWLIFFRWIESTNSKKSSQKFLGAEKKETLPSPHKEVAEKIKHKKISLQQQPKHWGKLMEKELTYISSKGYVPEA